MKSTIIVIILIAVVTSFPSLVMAQSESGDKTVHRGFADVNGTKLNYEIAGKGEPVVFIHGSFGDRRHWDFQFKKLSKKFKVLRYDVRGYGKSALPNPDEPYRDSDDLNALMEFLGIKEAHICGLSMGSVIAIDFALSYPDKCISLIPMGPRVAGDGSDEYRTPNSDTVRKTILKVVDILKKSGAKEATDYLWTGNHSLSQGIVSPVTRKALLKMGYEYSWWRSLHVSKREYAFPMGIKKLGEIKVPTLVVTAEYDFELCKEIANIIAKEIPGAKLISIKGAGHIMNMDKPDDFNTLISEFIVKVK